MSRDKKQDLIELIIFIVLQMIMLIKVNEILASNLGTFISIAVNFVCSISIIYIPLLVMRDKNLNLGFEMGKMWLQLLYGVILFVMILIIYKLFGNFSTGVPLKLDFYFAYTLVSSLNAAITEELGYRGLLLTRVQHIFGKFPAVLTSAVLFGISHFQVGDLHYILFLIAFGCLLGAARAYRKKCTLISTMTAHFLFDFLICYLTL